MVRTQLLDSRVDMSFARMRTRFQCIAAGAAVVITSIQLLGSVRPVVHLDRWPSFLPGCSPGADG
ncbi:hypothetical protein [Streptomyces sp. NBC_00624]|uniref:hypothetical protein n=1 Tax=Streptomyces sp. NBC_00624 TaxID=2975791 RepID=UPI0030E4A290